MHIASLTDKTCETSNHIFLKIKKRGSGGWERGWAKFVIADFDLKLLNPEIIFISIKAKAICEVEKTLDDSAVVAVCVFILNQAKQN